MAADVVYHVFLCYFERGMKKNKLYLFAILAQLSGAAESNNPPQKNKNKTKHRKPLWPMEKEIYRFNNDCKTNR